MSKVYKHRVLYSSIKPWNSLSTSCGSRNPVAEAGMLMQQGFGRLEKEICFDVKGNAFTSFLL